MLGIAGCFASIAFAPLPSSVSRSAHPPLQSRFATANLYDAYVTGRNEDSRNEAAEVLGSFHLAKAIVGSGWLSLPAGVTALANDVGEGQALPVALFLLVLFAATSAASYREVVAAAAETGSGSFAECYGRCSAPGGSRAAGMICALNCLGGCVSFAVLLGDAFTPMLSSVLGPVETFGVPLRFYSIIIITFCLLQPLCSKLDFKSMSWTSGFGTCATIGATAAMAYRWADCSYASAVSQLDVTDADILNHAVTSDPGHGIFVLSALLANGFTAHHCAPQLQKAVSGQDEKSGCTKPSADFDKVIVGGFSLSALLYAVVIVCGYLTFGPACKSNVLDGYADTDSLAVAARLATLASLVCSFPAMLLGLRDSLRDLGAEFGQRELEIPSPVLLALIAVLAGLCTDIAAGTAAQGALLGTLLVYGCPALMAASRRSVASTRLKKLTVAGGNL